jgi:hypothetical protein
MQQVMIKNIMIKNVIKLIIISLTFLFCEYAKAGLTIGSSIIYTNIDDPRYKFVKEYEFNPKNLNFGYFKFFKNNLVLTIQTNRLYNPSSIRSVIDKNNGITLQNESKITTDNLLLGYYSNRFIPSLIISNIKLDKTLYYKSKKQGREINHAIVYGLNFGYLLNKNLNTSLVIIFPNKELYLKSALGISVNYLF